MKTLRQIIAEDGDKVVAEALGFSEVYMRHIRTGKRPASARVLSKALAVYGSRLDAGASLPQTEAA